MGQLPATPCTKVIFTSRHAMLTWDKTHRQLENKVSGKKGITIVHLPELY